MKTIILGLFMLFSMITFLHSQTSSYRLKFRYHISKEKLKDLNDQGYVITDGTTTNYSFCPALNKSFKCLVTNKDGELFIDPWQIEHDKGGSDAKGAVDPCYGQERIINAATPNKLKLVKLSRDKVGDPTRSITLHYQTVIVGINAIGVKVRPSVVDYNNNQYSANVVTGNINLGFSVGYSWGWTTFSHRSSTSWSVTPGASFGFSSASLGKEPLKKKVVTTYNPSNLVLSPSAGLTIARNDIGIIFNP